MSLAQIFSDELWNFGLPTLRCTILNALAFIKEVGMPTIAAVGQGNVLYNSDMIEASEDPEELFLQATKHEFGHPYLPYSAPGTFRNKLDDAKAVSKLLGDKNMLSVWDLLNICYDMIIDILSHDRVDYTPVPVLKAFDQIDSSTPTSYVGQSLIAFREEMMNDRFSGHDIEEIVRVACRKIVKIVRDPATAEDPRKRVLDICRILIELYTSQPDQDEDDGDGDGEGQEGDGESEGEPQDGEPSNGKSKKGKQKGASKSKPKKGKSGKLTEEELQELAERIKEAIEEMGLTEATTVEDQSDDPTEAKIKATDLSDKDDRDAAIAALKLSEDDAAFEMLWSAAEERVRLQTPLCGVGEGTAFPAGSVPWAPGMPLRDLNVESTLLGGGIFIPGVTSVQDYIVPGPGMPVEGRFPRVAVSCDVSGSLRSRSPIRNSYSNLDLCLMSIYAMFHEAKRRRVPILGSLFADRSYTSKEGWSTDYKKVARELFNNQDRPGGGNSCTGSDGKVEELLRPGDMFIYITDFELCGSESLAAKQLQRFVQEGVNIVFIAMFRHCAELAGIPFVECKELKDLENVALHSFQ